MADAPLLEEQYTPQDAFDDWLPLVTSTARLWAGKYRKYVSAEEVSQELWTWLLRPEVRVKVAERMANEGHKPAARKLGMQLRDRAKGFCITAQAQAVGFATMDLHWYSKGQLMELLPAVLDAESWTSAPDRSDDVKVKSTSRPDEGGNRLATLADVSAALYALRRQDQQVLVLRYGGSGLTMRQLANFLDVDEDAAEKRVSRALDRLLEKLGGEPPVWPRGAHR